VRSGKRQELLGKAMSNDKAQSSNEISMVKRFYDI
jgi:hypothetical protein